MSEDQRQAYSSWRSVIQPQKEPLLNKARQLIGAEQVNPYTLFALGPDVSHWTPKNTDYSGVDFAILKIGGSENAPVYGNPYIDDTFNFWMDYFYNLPNPQGGVGVPIIVYYMQNPRVYLDNQMTMKNVEQCDEHTHPVLSDVKDEGILKALHNGSAWKPIYGFFYDYEEASYWTQGDPIGDVWQNFMIDDLTNRFRGKIKANEKPYPFPKIFQGLYSRLSFMTEHYGGAKNPSNLWDWLHRHPELETWPSNYPRKIPNLSVSEIRKSWLPQANWVPYLLAEEDDPKNPLRRLPWSFWQFSGEPDWNLYNGTPQELYSWLGFTPRAHVDNPVFTKGSLDRGTGVNVRYTPQVTLTNILGTMKAGSVVDVYGTKTVGNQLWIQINRDLWMCAKNGSQILITLS